jgi:hypothetical protein
MTQSRGKAMGIEAAAQLAQHPHKRRREVLGFLGAAGGGPLFGRCFSSGFAHRGHFLKAHGQPARAAVAIKAVEGRQERGLQEALAPPQIGLERRAQGIAVPEGRFDLLPRAPKPRVVQADHEVVGTVSANRALHDGCKQGVRIPVTAVEELVIGTPIPVLAVIKANGPGDGAPPQATEQAQRQGEGPLTGAPLAKRRRPIFQQLEQLLQQHRQKLRPHFAQSKR